MVCSPRRSILSYTGHYSYDCCASGSEAHLFMIHVICDMLHHWASGCQHFKEMECHLRVMTSQTLKMKAVCLFRTNCPTMQCPFQKTGILNYATEKISILAAIYIVEQQSFQSKP